MLHRSAILSALAAICTAALLVTACAGKAVAPNATPIPPSNETQRLGIVVLEDEIVLSGRLFGPANEPVVILSHMRPNDQTAWFSFAEQLAEAGYAALTYDFRGYGESEGEQDFGKLDDDLRAVISYMRDQGRDEIFLVGASMGGTTSLVVAEGEALSGVVAISAPAQFEGQDALAAVPLITDPKLLIASEGDTAALLSLEEMEQAAAPPIQSEVFPGNAHGTDMLDPLRSDVAAETRQAIIDFLDDNSG